MDEVLLQALDSLVKRRDAFDNAIAALRAVTGGPSNGAEITSVVNQALDGAIRKLTEEETPKRPKAAKVTSTSRTLTGEPNERESAILHRLRTNGRMGTSRELRAAMPKEPLSVEQSDAAYRNTMSKLKAKGLVSRTGDTWSLIDRD